MRTVFYKVKSSKAIYSKTLTCVDTGVTVTVNIPVDVAEKEEIINRVSQAIATVDCFRIQVEG